MKNGLVLSSKLALFFCDGLGDNLEVLEFTVALNNAAVAISCRS